MSNGSLNILETPRVCHVLEFVKLLQTHCNQCKFGILSKRCISFGQECMISNAGAFFNFAVFQVMFQKDFVSKYPMNSKIQISDVMSGENCRIFHNSWFSWVDMHSNILKLYSESKYSVESVSGKYLENGWPDQHWDFFCTWWPFSDLQPWFFDSGEMLYITTFYDHSILHYM